MPKRLCVCFKFCSLVSLSGGYIIRLHIRAHVFMLAALICGQHSTQGSKKKLRVLGAHKVQDGSKSHFRLFFLTWHLLVTSRSSAQPLDERLINLALLTILWQFLSKTYSTNTGSQYSMIHQLQISSNLISYLWKSK